MKSSRLKYLYDQYQNNCLTHEELLEWDEALIDRKNDEILLGMIDIDWHTKKRSDAVPETQKQLEIYDYVISNSNRHKQLRKYPMWSKITIAAASVILILGAAIFYLHKDANSGNMTYRDDVQPGKKGATLTLANGKKIRLAQAGSGEIAKQEDVSIVKTADGQLVYQVGSQRNISNESSNNILSTSTGELYSLILPDQTRIWMNSSSSISYSPTLYVKGKRVVKLTGEAYFEIYEDKAHPFIVETQDQKVEVLGTHFNINSYLDEKVITTTLLEGAIKISNANQTKLLKPGEQSLNNGADLKVTKADLEKAIDWKNGDFFLNHVNFKTATRKIARWYDVQFIFESSVPDDIESGGWISMDKKLSEVLRLIESSGQVHFRVEGKKVYVSR